MNYIIAQLTIGIRQADEHYNDTRHIIKEYFQQIPNRERGQFDLIKKFQCTECDFTSQAIKRIVRFKLR